MTVSSRPDCFVGFLFLVYFYALKLHRAASHYVASAQPITDCDSSTSMASSNAATLIKDWPYSHFGVQIGRGY